MLRVAAVGLSLIWCAGIVLAHSGASGIVKHRMDGMKSVAKSMKTVKTEIAKSSPDKRALNDALSTIQSNSGDNLIKLFPAGSLDAPTEASPNIWTNEQEFKDLANRMARTANMMRLTLNNSQALGNRKENLRVLFEDLSATCRDCHKSFRIEK